MPEMSGPAYDNLEMLNETFGANTIANLFDKQETEIDGVSFVSEYASNSTADRFSIVKPAHLIERYRSICNEANGGRILELGIAEGGSTALLALLSDPAKLVAVDLEPARSEALDEFILARGLADRVRAYYGVDQSDRAALQGIVAGEFGDKPLDLVIDDASHMYAPTVASFEALMPYVRPGGRYLVEDWNADIEMMEAVRQAVQDPQNPHHEQTKQRLAEALAEQRGSRLAAPRVPLARFALEMTLACGAQRGIVAELAFNRSYIELTRGDAEVDAATFTVADLYGDAFGLIGPLPGA